MTTQPEGHLSIHIDIIRITFVKYNPKYFTKTKAETGVH